MRTYGLEEDVVNKILRWLFSGWPTLIPPWKNLSSFPFLFALKTPINFMLKRKYGLEKDVKCMTIVGIRL